jgi:NAD(P)H dehydrogenase (quinone)
MPAADRTVKGHQQMTIVVTGASGHLGRLIVENLLAGGVPAAQIVAAVRTPQKAAGLADRGVQVREADYDRPETLAPAFAGAGRLLLVSGTEIGRRVPQHQAVVDAARKAGADHIAYTSIPYADTTPIALAPEHKATEELIRASGLPFTFLRNGWYTENYDAPITQAASTGTLIGSAGDGRVSAAARADYAAAAAAVLTGEGHQGKAYELGGDPAWTYSDLAAEISRAAGTPVAYHNLTPGQHKQALADARLPQHYIELMVDSDQAIAAGYLETHSGDLTTLIGRPTITLADAVAASLKNA